MLRSAAVKNLSSSLLRPGLAALLLALTAPASAQTPWVGARAMGMGGADQSFRSPMAIAVIGGLITSTVLSLVVIPVVYTYVDDIEQFFRRQVRRLRHKEPHAAAQPGTQP